jgi:glutamate racemase
MIGVFDSGYGGLTVLRSLVEKLPQYDYLYLGDNARAPYGTRSFETVYAYTLEAVKWLFSQGCPLVILACNTASAKALRSIQQRDLPDMPEGLRVLGVIRPTAEVIGQYSRTGEIGILATPGTVSSDSYPMEIAKFYPHLKVHQQACPMWVPLIENNEHRNPGADFFIKKCVDELMAQSPQDLQGPDLGGPAGGIDTVLLACTHYPLLQDRVSALVGPGVRVVSQGDIVADSLADYLQRHPEMEQKLGKGGARRFCTTDSARDFNEKASLFYGEPVSSEHVHL